MLFTNLFFLVFTGKKINITSEINPYVSSVIGIITFDVFLQHHTKGYNINTSENSIFVHLVIFTFTLVTRSQRLDLLAKG